MLSDRLRQIADRLDDGYLTMRKAAEDLKAIVATMLIRLTPKVQ